MPNPSLSSFINSSQYNSLPGQAVGFVAGYIPGVSGGSTYYNYSQPVFSGQDGAASNDPGGLFGWLLYARSRIGKGSTADTYIEYSGPKQLIVDMNALGGTSTLSGITYCLLSTQSQGGTYGFFTGGVPVITEKTYGSDFLFALNYLAYGNVLVIAGTTSGLNDYENQNHTRIDALIGSTANAAVCSWLVNKPYAFGIFPTIPDSTGKIGAGFTMADYTSFVGATFAASGSTFSTRIINVCGIKSVNDTRTDSLLFNTIIPTYFLSAVSDVAGFISKAKNSNTLFTSPAGSNNAVPLNGSIVNGIQSTNSELISSLVKNRVNFFYNYTNTFLGKDMVGATANSNTPSALERIGPQSLKIQIQNDVSDIALKYLFTINNAVTRNSVISEVQSYLNTLNTFIDPKYTQIICDTTNGNVDNTNSLYITLYFKPIASVDTFVVNVNIVA